MSSKIILFAGAPDSSSIDWASSKLLTHFLPPFSTFLELHSSSQGENDDDTLTRGQDISRNTSIAWRSIPLAHTPLDTGLSRHHAALPNFMFQADPNFCSTASFLNSLDLYTSAEPEASDGASQQHQSILSQFYNHSLAQHQVIPSSQLPDPAPSLDETTTTSLFLDSKSFSSDNASNNDSFSDRATISALKAHLSDLEDIPSAKRLLSLIPQTVSVNLIAGIISIASPRTVVTRWGAHMSLIEILLGDDTRAGFSVTFWLPATTKHHHNNTSGTHSAAQGHILERLRRQDIVLLQNVGLHVFNGRVYGQSLRKGMTKVDLLHRWRLEPGDEECGPYRARDFSRKIPKGRLLHPQFEKTKRVRDWVIRFVGAADAPKAPLAGRRTTRASARKRWDDMPDDTQ